MNHSNNGVNQILSKFGHQIKIQAISNIIMEGVHILKAHLM